jgi:hypothetical protein
MLMPNSPEHKHRKVWRWHTAVSHRPPVEAAAAAAPVVQSALHTAVRCSMFAKTPTVV